MFKALLLAVLTTFASFVLSQAAPMLRAPYGYLPQAAASFIFGMLAVACVVRLSKTANRAWWFVMAPALALLTFLMLDDAYRLVEMVA